MAVTFPLYATVALDVAIDKTLEYGVPEALLEAVRRGVRVEVPVRGHLRQGYVIGVNTEPSFAKVVPIKRVISEAEVLNDELLDLILWVAKYYHAPLSQVLKVAVPASIRKKVEHKQQLFVMRAKPVEELRRDSLEVREKSPAQAEILEVMLKVRKGILLTELLEQAKTSRSPVDTLVKKGYLLTDIVRIDRSQLIDEEYFRTKPKKLNQDQETALQRIVETLNENAFHTHLLHGITGSGKTEVYLQALDAALKRGKGVILLVPEIALTPQTIERFRSRFDLPVAALHYRLSHAERYETWHKIRQGEIKIVIGARSAVFSPVKDLGLIIVDEEHESSYKQSDEAPFYHARDVAVMRGHKTGSTVILGSATPSLESALNADQGKYTLSTLKVRAEASSLPNISIVDMRPEYQKAKGFTNFSEKLLEGIKRRQALGEQTILFLNRRGYHTSLHCLGCGATLKCNHCDLALTFHKGNRHLSCHLCGYCVTPIPTVCPTCKKQAPMKFRGVGTEQVEASLHAIFPEIRTIRVDADTTRHKGSHQKLFRDFGTGKADVLIGTQMVAKGLHFTEVTLVGILNSDATLQIPDFRASESAFQLMTQVAGRAGRGSVAGEVIIQTSMPDNPTICHAAAQDYQGFYKAEIASRKLFHYPPFASLVKVTLSGPNPNKTLQTAEAIRQAAAGQLPKSYTLNPSTPAGHAKVKDRYRFQFLIRGPKIALINAALGVAKGQVKLPYQVRMSIDVNPLSTY